ncbi:uncharacterized protein LOC115787326 [Archocentrus centrarchus]|uniref:uncharacterized protein LOC115787326 n=1 Tax=Archocentrus centrarchus TaxID=63155 RepID=UPI0011E9F584|nr:uncharacterized protein LOC115787326 [Archocentrus centrarchus]
MLLVFLTVSGVFFALAASIQTDVVCYGKSWQFPSTYRHLLHYGLYFTQSNGGSIKTVINNGKILDPRFRVSPDSIYLSDVTERDEGVYTLLLGGFKPLDVVDLKVLECDEEVTKDYFSTWAYSIPRGAEFLEFTPLHSWNQAKILWNRTDPEVREIRAQVENNIWELSYLTQADSGYYSFSDQDHSVLARVLLKVQEITVHYDAKANERFLVAYPLAVKMWSVTFTPNGEKEPRTRMNGSLIIKDNWFFDRIQAVTQGIEIDPVEMIDSGTFKFRDPEGNLALIARVEVNEGFRSQIILFALIALVAFMVTVCCWCCCKKRCCKKDKSAPQTAASPAPAVYHHNENQPQGSIYSSEPPPPYLPYQPVNSHVSDQPTATSPEPPAYHEVSIHVNPSQPEVALPGRPGSTPSSSVRLDFLASDPEPQFEMKGLTVPSAPPLSSDSSSIDVYNSEKLNFL